MPPWHLSARWGLRHSQVVLMVAAAPGSPPGRSTGMASHGGSSPPRPLHGTGTSRGVHPAPLLHPGMFRNYCALPQGNTAPVQK